MLLLFALFFSFITTIPHEVAAEGFLTGSQTLEITDYSIIKKGIVSGNYVQSNTFTVGNNQWTIEFYPQGLNSTYSDSVSIMVRLINPRNVVRAIFTHRLREWNNSTWSTDTPVSSNVETFSPSGYTGWGYFSFMKRSNLETSNYLRNDSLVIKTTLWVAKGSSTVLLPTLSTVPDILPVGNSNQDVSSSNSENQADA